MRFTKTLAFISVILMVLMCSASVVVLTRQSLKEHGWDENDLRRKTFYTSGQVIFTRPSESFDSSRRGASEPLRPPTQTGLFEEKIALQSNATGLFHHMTDSLIYIQFYASEVVVPFRLSDGKLDSREIYFDGKKYEYEEGEATLVVNPR